MSKSMLVFATAKKPLIEKAISSFFSEFDKITILVTRPFAAEYQGFSVGKVQCLFVDSERLDMSCASVISEINGINFDTVLISSGSYGFVRFYNILEIVSKLKINTLMFANVEMKTQKFNISTGILKKIRDTESRLLVGFFFISNRVTNFFERIMCRCAGLLGL
jgi:hypothetical protein